METAIIPALEAKLEAADEVVRSAQEDHNKAVLAAGQAKVQFYKQQVAKEVETAQKAIDKLAAHAVKIHDIQDEALHVYSDEVKPYFGGEDKQKWELKLQSMKKPGRIFEAAVKQAKVVWLWTR